MALGLFPIREDGEWYFSVPFIERPGISGASVALGMCRQHQRDEILALMFSLSALYAAMKYYDTRKVLWIALSAVSLFLGMLAKENALTFLAVIR